MHITNTTARDIKIRYSPVGEKGITTLLRANEAKELQCSAGVATLEAELPSGYASGHVPCDYPVRLTENDIIFDGKSAVLVRFSSDKSKFGVQFALFIILLMVLIILLLKVKQH